MEGLMGHSWEGGFWNREQAGFKGKRVERLAGGDHRVRAFAQDKDS